MKKSKKEKKIFVILVQNGADVARGPVISRVIVRFSSFLFFSFYFVILFLFSFPFSLLILLSLSQFLPSILTEIEPKEKQTDKEKKCNKWKPKRKEDQEKIETQRRKNPPFFSSVLSSIFNPFLALLGAVSNQNEEMVQFLISSGANPDTGMPGAGVYGFEPIAKLLIEKVFNPFFVSSSFLLFSFLSSFFSFFFSLIYFF